MGDNAGDGEKGFFEGRFFNIFRDKEENAGAAADRAVKAVAQAEYRAALVANDEDNQGADPNAPGMSAVATPQGGRPIKDIAARKNLQKVKRMLKAQEKINEETEKDLEKIREFLKEQAKAHDRQEGIMGTWLERGITVTGALVGLLNVNDAPTIPIALQLARAMEVGQVVGWTNGTRMTRLASNLLTILAYYDPKVGLESLWTTKDARGRKVGGLSAAFGGLLTGGSVAAGGTSSGSGGGGRINF